MFFFLSKWSREDRKVWISDIFNPANETCAAILHRYTHLMLVLLTEIQSLFVKKKKKSCLPTQNKRKSISTETERKGLKASSSLLTASRLIRIKPGLSLPPLLYHHSTELSSSLMTWPVLRFPAAIFQTGWLYPRKQNEWELHCKLQYKCWHFCKNFTCFTH